jgi:hypothetical protein
MQSELARVNMRAISEVSRGDERYGRWMMSRVVMYVEVKGLVVSEPGEKKGSPSRVSGHLSQLALQIYRQLGWGVRPIGRFRNKGYIQSGVV